MNEHSNPVFDRVNESLLSLFGNAQLLNEASDNLKKSIAYLETSLKQLGLGIFAWVTVSSSNDGGAYSGHKLGYAKIGPRWGFVIRLEEGHEAHPDSEVIEMFPFNDAPRHLRLMAVEKIPELIEKLNTEAIATTTRINAKSAEVSQIALAATPPPRPPSHRVGSGEFKLPPRAAAPSASIPSVQTQTKALPPRLLPLNKQVKG